MRFDPMKVDPAHAAEAYTNILERLLAIARNAPPPFTCRVDGLNYNHFRHMLNCHALAIHATLCYLHEVRGYKPQMLIYTLEHLTSSENELNAADCTILLLLTATAFGTTERAISFASDEVRKQLVEWLLNSAGIHSLPPEATLPA